jgi:hypothetical protein
MPHEAFCWFMPELPPPEGCWDWRGPVDRNGYGQFSCDGKTRRASRVSYEIYVAAVPNGVEMLHSCDRHICVHPAHVRPDTHTENMREAYERGLMPFRTGAANGNAKLTEEQARWILQGRQMGSGFTAEDFGRAFGVTAECIHNLWGRRTWRHI